MTALVRPPCTTDVTDGLCVFPYFAVWLGWAYLNKKVHRPWHQGVYLNLPMVFALNLHKKVQGIVEGSRAVFTYARSYTQKTFFGPPKGDFGDIVLYTKT